MIAPKLSIFLNGVDIMKNNILVCCTTIMLWSGAASSSTIFTIDGTISQFGGTAGSALLQHYTDTYGISDGDTMSFEVEVDFQRQGEITNADGSITTLTDVPLQSNCDTCYGYSGIQYDYATLLSSSFDFSPFSTGLNYNVATSNYHTGMAIDSHWGYIDLSNLLRLSTDGESTNVLVYNWTLGHQMSASIDLDDGSGAVSYYGSNFSITDVNVIPVPAAVWLFTSGILGLLGFMRRKH